MSDIVHAFVGQEEAERSGDQTADLLKAPRARSARKNAFSLAKASSIGLERFPLRRSNAVAAVPGVVRAFVWGEEAERGRDQTADLLKVPRPRGA